MMASGRLSRLRGRLLRAIAIGLVVSAAVTGLSCLGLFAGWEARAVDAFVFLREQEPAPDLVLVTIDEDAFRELGECQPLSRRYLADLGEYLLRSGARVVGFDIVMRTPTSVDEDQALLDTVQCWARTRPGAIVFASLLEPRTGGSAPGYALLPPFTADMPALFGFASAPQGADGMVRRLIPLLPSRVGGFLPGFPLAVLARRRRAILSRAQPRARRAGWRDHALVVARRRLRAAFGQYVSPEVLERVVREGTDLAGEVRAVSVLMSDLRGFTTLSEQLPPAVVSETISEYLTAMTDVILAHGGYVIDFVGDGILAVFGAPLDDPEHTWHAVQTALGMQAAIERLNGAWQAAGRTSLTMGMAVHTGEVFAGTLGAPRKKKYTVLGDPVNTTSRIEGLNRELGTAILISGAALGAVKGRVRARDRGAVTVKGRRQPVELFELLALEEES